MLTSLATPFLFLGSLAPNPFSTSQIAQASISCADVYIAGSGVAGATLLRNVLNVLDVVDIGDGHVPNTPAVKTFQELPRDIRYQDVLNACPAAKFIFATDKSEAVDVSSGNSEGNFTRYPLLSGVDKARLLEIEIRGAEKHAGETWERLCQFLGMGYSILERKGLRKFPGGMGGREELRRGLGGRFSYGYAGIGEGLSR